MYLELYLSSKVRELVKTCFYITLFVREEHYQLHIHIYMETINLKSR